MAREHKHAVCQGATHRWLCSSQRCSLVQVGVFRVRRSARGHPAGPKWASPQNIVFGAQWAGVPRVRPELSSRVLHEKAVLQRRRSASLCAGPALQPAVAPWRAFQFVGKLHALGQIHNSSGPAPRQVVVRGPHARTTVSRAYVYILSSLAWAPRRPWEFSAPRPGPRIQTFFNLHSTWERSRDISCRRSCSALALSIILFRSFST